MTAQSEVFLADILAEPDTLTAILDTYGGVASPLDLLGSPKERRVVFVGMGSSRFAAIAAAHLLRARGFDSWVEYASSGWTAPPETLVVAVSASGSTAETVEAAERHRASARVVAVTNRPDSPLAAAAHVVLPLLAGEEAGGIACRTYQASVAVLLLLAGRVAGAPDITELRPAEAALAELLRTRGEWVAPALEILGGGAIDVIAPADRQSSAAQSALMLREAPRLRAAACETADWLHVDVYLTRPPGYRAILFPGSASDAEVLDWVKRRGAAAVAVGAPTRGAAYHVGYPGAADPLVALLVETTAVELLAAELWRRSLI